MHGVRFEIITAGTENNSDHQCAQGTYWKQQAWGRSVDREEPREPKGRNTKEGGREGGSFQRLKPLKRMEECLGRLNGRLEMEEERTTELKKMSEETSKALEKMTPKNIPSIKLMQGGKEKGRGKEYFK